MKKKTCENYVNYYNSKSYVRSRSDKTGQSDPFLVHWKRVGMDQSV